MSAEVGAPDFDLAPGARVHRSTGPGAGRALLSDALGSEAAVDRALGRPALDGSVGQGPSPKRQVRLTRELDELLIARAASERRRPSDIMREALVEYLHKAS